MTLSGRYGISMAFVCIMILGLVAAAAVMVPGLLLAQDPASSKTATEKTPEGKAPPSAANKGDIEKGGSAGTNQADRDKGWQAVLHGIDWPAALHVFEAFCVGLLGAWAFYLAVFTGFIARSERDRVLLYLSDDRNDPLRWRVRWLFYSFGGVVAGIFQWAQADTFAPIQAFVLGATWPSVVSRIMAGDGGRGLQELATNPNAPVPPPPEQAAQRPREVVISPVSPAAPATGQQPGP